MIELIGMAIVTILFYWLLIRTIRRLMGRHER